jgi:hypothetical protein
MKKTWLLPLLLYMFLCQSVISAGTFQRKSVLTVTDQIYTDMDAEIIIWIWNLFSPKPFKKSTDWKIKLGLGNSPASLPDDAKTLLFATSAWSESKRLNLFSPSKKDIELKLDIAKDPSSLKQLSVTAQKFWIEQSSESKSLYLDIVLRAMSFEKTRGGFEKNQALAAMAWYWHESK